MIAGLEVFNEDGFKVAGTDYPNLVLYGKYNITVQGGEYVTSPTGVRLYWDAYAIPPNDGSTIRFYRAPFPVVEQGGRARAHTNRIGSVIECYSFGPVKPSPANFGLEVYSETGALTFNTGNPFLNLKGVHYDTRNYMLDFQVGNASYPAQNTGFGSGKYAWSSGNSRYFYRRTQYSGGFTDEFESVLAVRVDDTGVYSTLAFQFGATKRTDGWVGYGNHVPQTGPISVLVADVSSL